MKGARIRRFLAALAALGAPAAAVFFALFAAGHLAGGPAVLGLAATAAGIAALVWHHLAGIEALRARVDDLAHRRAPASPPARHRSSADDIARAVDELDRAAHRREQELRSLAATNQAILDAMPDPLVLLDDTRAIVQANAAAAELLGGGLAGRDLASVLRDPGVLAAVEEALAGAPAPARKFSLPGPVERYFSARALRLARALPGHGSLVLALSDITAIEHAERMRADFLANVSHELRTPLSTLLGFTETLQGAASEDKATRQRFLAIMHEQASRMTRLVEDLLSLSKIEAGEHLPPTGRVELGPLIAGVAAALKPQSQAAAIELGVDVAADLPPVIGDSDQLAQVFQNLIDNAIKYGRKGGKVEVSAVPGDRPRHAALRVAGPLVAVAVADHGEGIAREHLPRLTERFYRVDSARSSQLGSTGLGLAIVKHILNRHRGALAIDSEVGRGSVFTVYLPAAGPRPGAAG
ncbi:MAG: sensor histidine kinase [Pseudomonadota bacterium]